MHVSRYVHTAATKMTANAYIRTDNPANGNNKGDEVSAGMNSWRDITGSEAMKNNDMHSIPQDYGIGTFLLAYILIFHHDR